MRAGRGGSDVGKREISSAQDARKLWPGATWAVGSLFKKGPGTIFFYKVGYVTSSPSPVLISDGPRGIHARRSLGLVCGHFHRDSHGSRLVGGGGGLL